MSPKEHRIASGRPAMAMARSMVATGVTHTGHPGPCTSSTSAGSRRSIPWRISVWVWPPQTSMSVHGLVTVARISPSSRRAIRPSRYSSTNLIARATRLEAPRSRPDAFRILRKVHALQVPHLREQGVGTGRSLLVDGRDGEPHVDHHERADNDAGLVGQARLSPDPSEVDHGHPETVFLEDLDHLPGYAEAHGQPPIPEARPWATRTCP